MFEKIIEKILKNEGGFIDNKNDKGGVTNYGISLKFLKAINEKATYEDIKKLSKEQAVLLYKQHFYLKNNLNKINDLKICYYLLDMCINHGSKKAIIILQSCLESVKIDGVCGKETINKTNEVFSTPLLNKLIEKRVEFYNNIVKSNPTQKVFLKGWLRRSRDVI